MSRPRKGFLTLDVPAQMLQTQFQTWMLRPQSAQNLTIARKSTFAPQQSPYDPHLVTDGNRV
uniref:Uncharacterized protein n=1 Tax=Talaromyces marneffei PM1 TaxID=1077442 RepID=A0A093XHX0_TALMA